MHLTAYLLTYYLQIYTHIHIGTHLHSSGRMVAEEYSACVHARHI